MALLRADFYSNYLKRNVMLTAVIPVDKMEGEKRAKGRRGPYRTVYLLHGLFGRDVDWIDRTHVVETAEARDIALIMPSGEDGLYLNKPEINEWHGKFISEELIEVTRHLFPLSSKREDTALAGISIGAYTAVINGLLRPDRFGSIIALSGTFMRDRILEAVDSHSPRKRKYYERFFGDLDTVIGSEKDYVALAERFSENPELPKPRFYIACGESDNLCQSNRDFSELLRANDFDVTYWEPEIGGHEWPFWNAWIDCALDWYAPGEMKPTTAGGDYSALTSLRAPDKAIPMTGENPDNLG